MHSPQGSDSPIWIPPALTPTFVSSSGCFCLPMSVREPFSKRRSYPVLTHREMIRPHPLNQVTPLPAGFRFTGSIARGGMGEVYEAWELQLRESVAIKTIRADLAQHAEVIDRFRLEAEQRAQGCHLPSKCLSHSRTLL